MRKKLIKFLSKVGIFFIVFLLSVIITSKIVNKGNTDLTADIKKASLPVIYVNVNDEYVNCLHGYVSSMEGSYLRGAITPMSAERTIPIRIDTFGTPVTSVDYEVRTMDMERLIENGNISDFVYSENVITATIPVKDLIKDEQEYMLVVKLSLSDGRVASYYARFIDRAELYLNEKLKFVHEFSDKTFDKNTAREVMGYMESNSEGDNSSYGYVNIHSNFNQLSWGDLEPTLLGDKELRILDIDSKDANIMLSYRISAKGEMYDVKEYFKITRGSDRMYLMDYERTMNQIFDEDNVVIANGKIFHGILADPIDYKENEDASVYCFVQDHRLYSYNADTNSMARIFSFWDKENDDVRTLYEANNIKILYVDETGNVHFAVYGYMDRGNHEGEVGIAVYYYDGVYNTIEEQMFIPYSKSYEILKHDVESLCYVNKKDNLYLMFNGTIYNINLENSKAEVLASGLNETRFVSSADNSMIGWQPADNIYDYTTLRFMSLNAMTPVKIDAQPGHILLPLGFFNKDFVYGSVKTSTIMLDSTGRTVLPMDSIYIQNLNGEILKEYSNEGIYVTEVSFEENMMNLKRMIIDTDTGLFYNTTDDQIMNNETKESSKNVYKSVVTEEMETTWQTVLSKSVKKDNIRVLTPKEVIYEGKRYFYLNVKDVLKRYYVYSKGEIDYIYTDAADAVYSAEQVGGVVVDKKCSYIWKSGDRSAKTQIAGIETEKLANSPRECVAISLEEMLKTAGVYVDANTMLMAGKSVLNIMTDNLENGVALELSGCSLNAMLYYVSNGSPVMAMVEEDMAVLITGYDDNNLFIFNPLEGTISKRGRKDATAWFSSNGNRFITYVK